MVEPINNSQTRALLQTSYSAKVQPTPNEPEKTGNLLPVKEETVDPKEQQSTQELSAEQYENVVKKIAEYVQELKRELQFSVNHDTGDTVIYVVNPETGELIRTIPLDEAVNLAKNLPNGDWSLLNIRA